MRIRRVLPLIVALAIFSFSPVWAEGQKSSTKSSSSKSSGKSSSSSSEKTVHVKGYTKKDGTHVEGYDRKAPKSEGSSTSEKSTTTSTESSKASSTASTSATHPANYCDTCARDSHGRILRGAAAVDAFKKQTGFPKGRPGYVIDHIVPLACGGPDSTANMQWQTVEEAKTKDKVERHGCTK